MPFSSFPSSFPGLPTVSIVVPGQYNDMHSGSISAGDTWLQNNLDTYVQWAKTNNSLFILTFDEDDGSEGNRIATIFVGQMVKVGYQDSTSITHDNVLRTIEDMYNLSHAGNAASVSPITDCWVTSSTPPTVVNPASARPNPVTGTTTSLNVLGGPSANEQGYTYTWSSTGPAAVSFSASGTNAAKSSTATFASAGSYTLTVTIANLAGQTATSSVTVTVNQTYTNIAVSPASANVFTNQTVQFTASARDQFGSPMSPQPPFPWTVSGGGTINSTTGLFTAGNTAGGPFMVTATSGGKSGTASVTVNTGTPVLTTITVSPSSASVVTGGTQQFTATGYDQNGTPMSPQPMFTWTVSGGGTINSTTGLFTAGNTAGGSFTVAAAGGGKSGTASVTVVTSAPVLTSIVVSPSSASMGPGGTKQFTAQGYDQFGKPMTVAFMWTATGGTVTGTGYYYAGTTPGTYSVNATSGTVSGSAAVTITGGGTYASGGWLAPGSYCGALGIEPVLLMGLLLLARRRSRP